MGVVQYFCADINEKRHHDSCRPLLQRSWMSFPEPLSESHPFCKKPTSFDSWISTESKYVYQLKIHMGFRSRLSSGSRWTSGIKHSRFAISLAASHCGSTIHNHELTFISQESPCDALSNAIIFCGILQWMGRFITSDLHEAAARPSPAAPPNSNRMEPLPNMVVHQNEWYHSKGHSRLPTSSVNRWLIKIK